MLGKNQSGLLSLDNEIVLQQKALHSEKKKLKKKNQLNPNLIQIRRKMKKSRNDNIKSKEIGKNYLLLDCVFISSSHLPSCTKERNFSNSNLLERDRIDLENGEVFIKFL